MASEHPRSPSRYDADRASTFRKVELLENGLVSMETTPEHLVETAQRNTLESPLLPLLQSVTIKFQGFWEDRYDLETVRLFRDRVKAFEGNDVQVHWSAVVDKGEPVRL